MSTNSTTSQNPNVDTWESRIEKAAKVMGLDPQKVEEILNNPSFKITKEPCGLEMLSDESVTPFGDLRKLFCEDNTVAVPQLRMAIKYLRGDQKTKPTDTTITVDPDILDLQKKYGINIKFKLDDLGAEELIPLYNPIKKNAIYNSLVKKLGDKKVIAFKPDSNNVAIEETINYIVDLNDGYPEEESIEVDGEPVRLYSLGVLPDQEVEEDPLFPGSPLKRGRSLNNRVNWADVKLEDRQFLRVLLEAKGIDPNDRIRVTETIREVSTGHLVNLGAMFPEAYLEFKELKKKGELPKLTMSINDAATKKINNPFGVGNRRY
jgi:hypothetical protein